MQLPPLLFHGTSTAYLDQMLRDGLLPLTDNNRICLTDEFETAAHYARCMADWDTGVKEIEIGAFQPIVFSIPAKSLNPEFFVLEEGTLRLGSTGRGRELNLRERSWTWQSLFEATGAVGYSRPIPVTRAMVTYVPFDAEIAA